MGDMYVIPYLQKKYLLYFFPVNFIMDRSLMKLSAYMYPLIKVCPDSAELVTVTYTPAI